MALETKPALLPEWNADTSGTTNYVGITEPPQAKKDTGWEADEEPAAQYFNWLFSVIYAWLLFVWSYVRELAKVSTPDGLYIYGSSTGASASIATTIITFVQLGAGDAFIHTKRFFDAIGVGVTTAFAYNFQTTNPATGVYKFYLDSAGTIRVTAAAGSVPAGDLSLYSVSWTQGAPGTLATLVDLRTAVLGARPAFVDPLLATRQVNAPTFKENAINQDYVHYMGRLFFAAEVLADASADTATPPAATLGSAVYDASAAFGGATGIRIRKDAVGKYQILISTTDHDGTAVTPPLCIPTIIPTHATIGCSFSIARLNSTTINVFFYDPAGNAQDTPFYCAFLHMIDPLPAA